MNLSEKYPRTYHYKFSLGTTSDDRINHEWWDDIKKIETIVHTEKLDGEGTSLNEFGIFARSHAAPTTHPWAAHLKSKYELIKNDLAYNNLEFFGENLYAIHSIAYPNIEDHFYMFAVKCIDMWLSWEEVKWYADFFEYKTVPELGLRLINSELTDIMLTEEVLKFAAEPSVFGSINALTDLPCTREGVVSRNISEYSVNSFKNNVFKFVRKNHVQTGEHWTRNWKRASLKWEK